MKIYKKPFRPSQVTSKRTVHTYVHTVLIVQSAEDVLKNAYVRTVN